ncbi:MAG: hypothetical protein KME15_19820 [Drouetiella hepatica Uher 2000/2452]|jgi:hypothetical protein|uniref:Uncharacterized protein n=1 Tax=Drouetiella hepatica Uher 2000/2452 TaxID=904376 RepID=A0A951QE87_9CYAN|nr:hypothetical protein [Drouetiella hepatica Uher 2000/2452]
MPTPDELKQKLEDSLKTLIESVYEEEGIQVAEFVYDPLWQKEGKTIGGRFKGTDGNIYTFIKSEGELQLFQAQD